MDYNARILYRLMDESGVHTYVVQNIRTGLFRVGKIAPKLACAKSVDIKCQNIGVQELKTRIDYTAELYKLTDYIIVSMGRWDIFNSLGLHYNDLQGLRYGCGAFCTSTQRSIELARKLTGQVELSYGKPWVSKLIENSKVIKLKNHII